jgi:hypothetical protein
VGRCFLLEMATFAFCRRYFKILQLTLSALRRCPRLLSSVPPHVSDGELSGLKSINMEHYNGRCPSAAGTRLVMDVIGAPVDTADPTQTVIGSDCVTVNITRNGETM